MKAVLKFSEHDNCFSDMTSETCTGIIYIFNIIILFIFILLYYIYIYIIFYYIIPWGGWGSSVTAGSRSFGRGSLSCHRWRWARASACPRTGGRHPAGTRGPAGWSGGWTAGGRGDGRWRGLWLPRSRHDLSTKGYWWEGWILMMNYKRDIGERGGY